MKKNSQWPSLTVIKVQEIQPSQSVQRFSSTNEYDNKRTQPNLMLTLKKKKFVQPAVDFPFSHLT